MKLTTLSRKQMLLNSRLWSFVGICCLIHVTQLGCQDQGNLAPSLELPESERDLGIISPGEEKSVEFTLVNKGGATLNISNVSTSCGCTSAEAVPTALAAGQTGLLKVFFRAPEQMDPISHSVVFSTNDPSQERARVGIKAKPVWLADTKPGTIHLSVTEKGKLVESDLEIYSPRDLTFSIRAVRSSSDEVTVEKIRSDAARQFYKVRVNPNTVGNLKEMIELVTDLPGDYTLRVPVTAQVISKSAISPSRLLLGQQRKKAEISRQVQIPHDKNMRIESAHFESKDWSVTKMATAEELYESRQIRLDIVVPDSAGFHRTVLHVKAIPAEQSFSLPVSCYVIDN